MRDAQPGTGQHRDGKFRHHRHVQDRPVACLETLSLEDTGKALHRPQQLLISQRALVTWLALPDDRGAILAPSLAMSIQAVVRHVRGRTGEPLVKRGVRVIQHLVPLPEPVQLALGKIRPKRFRVGRRLRHERRARIAWLHVCPGREIFGGVVEIHRDIPSLFCLTRPQDRTRRTIPRSARHW